MRVRRRRGGGRQARASVGSLLLLSLALGGTLPQRGLEIAQLGDTRAQVGRDGEPPCLQLLLAGSGLGLGFRIGVRVGLRVWVGVRVTAATPAAVRPRATCSSEP